MLAMVRRPADVGPRPAEVESRRRSIWRPAAAAVASAAVLAVPGAGIWASLTAQATGVAAVQSGSLKLTLADSGSAGFGQSVANTAPGDAVNRYVTLTNTGTLAGRTLTLQIAASGTPTLITDGTGTRALRVSVAHCDQAWSATGTCGTPAGPTTLLNNAVLGSLATPTPFSGVTSAAVGAVLNLKVSIVLPDQNEHAVNGVVAGPSVQNGAVNLTYTFAQSQRTATAG